MVQKSSTAPSFGIQLLHRHSPLSNDNIMLAWQRTAIWLKVADTSAAQRDSDVVPITFGLDSEIGSFVSSEFALVEDKDHRGTVRSSSPPAPSDAQSQKRPRQNSPESASITSHVRAPLHTSESSARQSAASRFFKTPKLVSTLFSFMTLEKVDLITFTSVSTYLRGLALHLLVRSMSIPLSHADQVCDFFEANSGLIEHVRHIRIYDDEVHQYYLFDNHEPPLDRPDLDESERLFDLDRLFTLFEKRSTVPLPLFDFSLGHGGIMELYKMLQNRLSIQERVAAVRVISDFDPRHHPEYSTQESFRPLIIKIWDDLHKLLISICDTQNHASSTALRVFHYLDCMLYGAHLRAVLPSIKLELFEKLAPRLQDFAIAMSGADEGLDRLLSPEWPELQRFQLLASSMDVGHNSQLRDDVQRIINSFLRRSSQLNNLHIDLAWNFCALSDNPNLKKCYILVDGLIAAAATQFMQRHQKLDDLRLYASIRDEEAIAADFQPPPSLRVLRSSPEMVKACLQAGVRLSHVQLATSGTWDMLGLPECVHFNKTPADSITCLEVDVVLDHLDVVIPKIKKLFPRDVLPNLLELVLCTRMGHREAEMETREESAQILQRLLKELDRSVSPKLRALRVQHGGANYLPADRKLATIVKTFPRKLEYLSWNPSRLNNTQYYRVLRPLAFQGKAMKISTSASQSNTDVKLKAGEEADDVDAEDRTHGEEEMGGEEGNDEEEQAEEEDEGETDDEDEGMDEENADEEEETDGEEEETGDEDEDEATRKSVRLQSLPPSFRLKVNQETGVWDQPAQVNESYTLFEHTGSEPRLKAL
ncbi:hypothetical protein CF327_g1412 [Tilletia walkeri]|nr:hypothetical protein CF327_g1412 [Tilletia walkeri]